jgi:hypothetical protein
MSPEGYPKWVIEFDPARDAAPNENPKGPLSEPPAAL